MTCEQRQTLLQLVEQLRGRGFDVRVGWIDCDVHGKHAAHFRHSRVAASRSFPQTLDTPVERTPRWQKYKSTRRGTVSGQSCTRIKSRYRSDGNGSRWRCERPWRDGESDRLPQNGRGAVETPGHGYIAKVLRARIVMARRRGVSTAPRPFAEPVRLPITPRPSQRPSRPVYRRSGSGI